MTWTRLSRWAWDSPVDAVMFTLDQLRRPIVGAPMAGGPSTPALAAAVTNAGGLGFLAAGYKTPTAVADEVSRTRSLTDGPFGLNIFVPDHANVSATDFDPQERRRAVEDYRGRLTAGSGESGVAPGEVDPADDDQWAAKLELAQSLAVPVVSFTFGLPAPEVIDRLKAAGLSVCITVTDADEATTAVRHGADMLCVQGPLAGGHRSTHSLGKLPGTIGLLELLGGVRAAHSVPIIAAGGIARPAQVQEALAAGADAVQIGTMLLRSPESGAAAVHQAALVDPGFAGTTVTRAFSGRWARSVTNDFIRHHTEQAPAAYPEVNQLTKPLRNAAIKAADPQRTSLWASPYFAEASSDSAGDIVRWLVPER